MWEVYRAGLLMTVVKELSHYKLDLVGNTGQMGQVAPIQQANIRFVWKGE
jgi:hypothetical protein